jgi:hypothetical protein
MISPASTPETELSELLQEPPSLEVQALAQHASLRAMEGLGSEEGLRDLLKATSNELEQLQLHIASLEENLRFLNVMKAQRFRLEKLQGTLQTLLDAGTEAQEEHWQKPLGKTQKRKFTDEKKQGLHGASVGFSGGLKGNGVFLPELAFKQAEAYLPRKDSLNYALFKAIVLQGGRATTEQVHQYAIEQELCLPKTGEPIAGLSLSDMSSRINYLVRKGIVEAVGTGVFQACVGWQEQA